ncbi:hypothetical protein Sjap_022144 [Stephania japonica]|uniref:NAC domain-containing protein n=1 Tax=Stephania japonica TaxID=461633 RepID=A0AAP0ETP1_9MAGN
MENIPGFGFRFHPTDEELITHYLSKKVSDGNFNARVIGEVDLNKCEPWDLPFSSGDPFPSSHSTARLRRNTRLNLANSTNSTDHQQPIHRGLPELTTIHQHNRSPEAEIQRMREEMSQSAEEAGDDPHVDETNLYYKVVGVDHKGRVYGLGSTGRRYNDPGAISSQGRRARTLQLFNLMSHETLTPSTTVPTPALDANDVYRPRMYEPDDEEEMNLSLQQEWIDALSDTHPLPRPDKDN